MLWWIGLAVIALWLGLQIWLNKIIKPKTQRSLKIWRISSTIAILPVFLLLLNKLHEKSIETRLIDIQGEQIMQGLQIAPPKTIEEILKRIGKRCPEIGQPICDSISMAFFALRNHKYDQAVKIYLSLSHRFPNVPEIRFNLGTAYMIQGNWIKAREELEKVGKSDSDKVEVLDNLGIVRLLLKDTAQAKVAFQAGLQIEPDNLILHNSLGVLLKAEKNYPAAEQEFIRALAQDSNFAAAHFNLGNLYRDQGNLSQAERHYREVIRITPGDAGAHNSLGGVLKTLKQNVVAEMEFRESIRLRPNAVAAYVNLGGLLSDLGRLDEAESELRKAVTIDRNSIEAHYNLGICLFKKQIYPKAREEFQIAKVMALKIGNGVMVKRIDEVLRMRELK